MRIVYGIICAGALYGAWMYLGKYFSGEKSSTHVSSAGSTKGGGGRSF